MQPLCGDGEPPKQPRDKNEDDHDDKSGAAIPAAVNRIIAVSSPATPKRTTERQYLARLMRPLAPNRNSNNSSMVPLHEKCTGEPGTPKCVAPER